MGTNYYLYLTPNETLHIGKYSCGWRFTFRKQHKLKDIKDLNNILRKGTVKDEYGRIISATNFCKLVASTLAYRNIVPKATVIDDYAFVDCDFT